MDWRWGAAKNFPHFHQCQIFQIAFWFAHAALDLINYRHRVTEWLLITSMQLISECSIVTHFNCDCPTCAPLQHARLFYIIPVSQSVWKAFSSHPLANIPNWVIRCGSKMIAYSLHVWSEAVELLILLNIYLWRCVCIRFDSMMIFIWKKFYFIPQLIHSMM